MFLSLKVRSARVLLSLIGDADKSLIGSAAAVIVTRLISIFLSFISILVLARTLSVSNYGSYVFITTFLSLIGIFTSLGLPQIIVREIALSRGAQLPSNAYELLIFSYIIAILSGVLASLCLIASTIMSSFTSSVSYEVILLIRCAVIILPLSGVIMINSSILVGYEKILVSQLIDPILRPIVIISFTLLTYMINGQVISLQMALSILCLSVFLTAFISFVLVNQHIDKPRLLVSISHNTTQYMIWIKDGIHIALTQFMINLTTQIDILLLKWLASPSEVAIFHVGSRSAFVASFPYASLGTAVTPRLAHLYGQNNLSEIEHVARSSGRSALFGACVLTAGCVLFGPLYFRSLGPEFGPGYVVMIILLLGWIGLTMTGFATNVLFVLGFTSMPNKVIPFTLALAAGVAIVTIPKYGASGAAVAATLQMLVSSIALMVLCKRRTGISTGFGYSIAM